MPFGIGKKEIAFVMEYIYSQKRIFFLKFVWRLDLGSLLNVNM
jgi:hypothetical protein